MTHNFGFWRLGEEQHPRLSTLSRGNVPTRVEAFPVRKPLPAIGSQGGEPVVFLLSALYRSIVVYYTYTFPGVRISDKE